MNKKVSLIMPIYNAEKYLTEALDSILSQTYNEFEVIAINDGSTDKSLDILKAYSSKDSRIKVFDNDGNKGLPYTRKKGLELARGEYIALMDADDISYPKRFKEQVEYLNNNKEVSIVATNFDYLIDNNIIKVRKIYKKENLLNENIELKYKFMFFNPIVNSSVMFRKSFIIDNQINYRNEFFIAQDYMFWVDCINKGKIHIINKNLMAYRKGHENITKKSSETKKNSRKRLIDKIRVTVINNNGFNLSDSEILLFNKIFSDPYVLLEKSDFNNIYKVIDKMYLQIMKKNNAIIFINTAKKEIIKRIKITNLKFTDKVCIATKRLTNESLYTTLLSILRIIM